MRYFELLESDDPTISYGDLLAKYPDIANDLKDVGEWMNSDPVSLIYGLSIEPMSKFEKEAKEMYATYDEFPEDAARTEKIVNLLKKGAKQLPIFYDENHGFVMEGRHRMVAFYILGLKTVPVVKVKA